MEGEVVFIGHGVRIRVWRGFWSISEPLIMIVWLRTEGEVGGVCGLCRRGLRPRRVRQKCGPARFRRPKTSDVRPAILPL